MGFPEIVDVARDFAVMVRIQGPDPKGLKMRKHAFHHYNSGKTTLSASGMLLPGFTYTESIAKQTGSDDDLQLSRDSMLVLTVASVIEPFVSQQHRDDLAKDKPRLIPGVQIDIFVEGQRGAERDVNDAKKETAKWLPAELLNMVYIPAASAAVQSIIEASSGSVEHGWEVGSSLVSYADGQQSIDDVVRSKVEQSSFRSQKQIVNLNSPSVLGKLTTRVALLRVSSKLFKGISKLKEASSSKRGDVLLAIGSPFGILSHVHFFNSIAVGSIANYYPPNSSKRSLLMADLRCLPGMEGGPVFGEQAQFIGILTRPLRQTISGAEVQLVIPWEAIASACYDSLKEGPQVSSKELYDDNWKMNSAKKTLPIRLQVDRSSGHFHELLHADSSLPSTVEKAMTSICLISTDDGAWASGILLNRNGLILTNAHLLEPWRFRKAAAIGEKNRTKSVASSITSEECLPLKQDCFGGLTSRDMQLRGNETANISFGNECAESIFSYSRNASHRRIQVRMDFKEPWTWSDARIIYVSKGPLDIALLQLESVPDQLLQINIDFKSPSPGSKVYVVGHGLFGPRCELLPSACLGVIAKVVEAKKPLIHQSSSKLSSRGHFPVMLETTAAVHPGGSGGAVIDMDGHMIGLVTSNARHGGGIVIPHLNFSIPCAALEPIFNYSQDMQDLSLLDDLDKQNEDISSVWALTPAVSPKPGPLLPNLPPLSEDNEKSLKGSRFSKFLAERHELMKKPTHNGEVGSLSNKFLPSKL